jgi:hypothetical protein
MHRKPQYAGMNGPEAIRKKLFLGEFPNFGEILKLKIWGFQVHKTSPG